MTETAGDATLVADDVRKAYGDVVALDGVDLAVEPGEVFGLIGPNGAGKTTLVRALTGTTDIDGDVRVFGAHPRDVDPERVGLLPQAFDPPERLTARELVEYYGGLYEDPRDTNAVLDDVGLSDDADAWYETLSGGQKRRACVATALVNDPDVLFLDEPTTGIDPAGRRGLHRLIEKLAAEGTTIFLSSHAMGEVERLADRVALLRDGAVVAEGAPDRLIDEYGGDPHLDVELADEHTPGTTTDRLATETSFEVQAVEDRLRVSGVVPEEIATVVDALDAAEIAFDSLSWSEPTLEDVYLELTGETYAARPESGFESGEPMAADSGESDNAATERQAATTEGTQ